jgi:hypothetical protein
VHKKKRGYMVCTSNRCGRIKERRGVTWCAQATTLHRTPENLETADSSAKKDCHSRRPTAAAAAEAAILLAAVAVPPAGQLQYPAQPLQLSLPAASYHMQQQHS